VLSSGVSTVGGLPASGTAGSGISTGAGAGVGVDVGTDGTAGAGATGTGKTGYHAGGLIGVL
jgi:hypothetical protein